MDFNTLRTKYGKFAYKSYVVNDQDKSLSLRFEFSIDGLSSFVTTWDIAKVNKASYSKDKVDSLAFSLGLIESLSIWKLTCAKDFSIECFKLNNKQEEWFKKLLINGMGEFFYTNKIDISKIEKEIISVKSSGNKTYDVKESPYDDVLKDISSEKVLIPIGGGKDSAVSLELLNEMGRYAFIVNPRKATTDTFDASAISKDKLIIAKRVFDSKIVDYNKDGFLNGHTPFSALISFASVLAAYINGIPYVALSNESSANESTVKGIGVNHQYSKTYEYETDFITYEKENIDTGVQYFSFLRPLTEVGIACIFSRLDKYHKVFRSCNVGSKEDKWCAACAKCLFVYIILSPFIKGDKLIEIFGKDMLDDISLKDIFDKLIGIVPEKPFECVGSRDEVNAALCYVIDMYNGELPKLLKYYKELNIEKNDKLMDLCRKIDESNNLPEKFKKIISNYVKFI